MNQIQKDLPARPLPKLLPVLFFLGALAFLAAIYRASHTNSPDLPEGTLIGSAAPEYTLSRLEPHKNSETLSLQELLTDGKPIVMNFWASWCVSCIEEADDLEAFWKTYGDDIHVIGVAIQDTPEDAWAFASYHHHSFPLVLDEKGRIGIDYGIMGLPETFVIDRTGIVRHRFVGPVTVADLEKAALPL